MIRRDLLAILSAIQPGLADDPVIPITGHFWFTGTHVMAFNDLIAMRKPFATDFQGAIPGTTLLKMLSSSLVKELTMDVKGSHIEIKAGRTTMKLVLLLPDAFVFKMPKLSKPIPLEDDHPLFAAMRDCLLAVGDDYTTPDTLGVTIIQGEGKASLYATNRATMVITEVPGNLLGKVGTRVLLPKSFCAQMLKLASGADKAIMFDKDSVLFKSGNMQMFGRLLQSERPLDFPRVTREFLPAETQKMVTTPSKLKLIVDRSLIIADDERTSVAIRNGKAKFVTQSPRGEIIDSMVLEGHDDVELRVVTKWIKPVAEHFDKMLFSDKAFVMAKGKTYYMVAASAGQ